MSEINEKDSVESVILQLVTFKLGKEEFGFDIFKVKEINKMMEITQIPNLQKSIKGIVNLRGSIIPVISLREKLNFPEIENTSHTRIIVVEHFNKSIGFIVDEVSEVLRIESSTIEQPPEMTTNVDSDYITGVAKLENRLLILLALDKILIHENKKLEAIEE